MPFDGSLKNWPLTCDPHPTVMVRHLIAENDEYRSEALSFFINGSIKGGMMFLEEIVSLGSALGNEVL